MTTKGRPHKSVSRLHPWPMSNEYVWTWQFMDILIKSIPMSVQEVPCINPETCEEHPYLEVVATLAGIYLVDAGEWLD